MAVSREFDVCPANLSSMLDQPNVWSDWQATLYIGPLSWVRMAALLMRNVSVEEVINALAPPLASIREQMESQIVSYAANPPENTKYSVSYAGYCAYFEDEVPTAFRAFMERLGGNADVRWLRERIQADGVWEQSFLWFFLNGIAHASVYGNIDIEKIDDDARWLADTEFFEPARMAADQFLTWCFYRKFSERFDFVAPQPDELNASSLPIDPFNNWEDDWITRRRALDDRWERELGRAHLPPESAADLPSDAWLDFSSRNDWARALRVAKAPTLDWRWQAAFMLREVPLDDLIQKIETALLEMADTTARTVIEQARNRDRAVTDIRFGEWFMWWRENFRHWNDPLRGALNDFCSAGDAAFVGDWLTRFEPAVFADFLVQSAHGHVIERSLGFRRKGEPKPITQLFTLGADQPIKSMSLEDMTRKLYRRFRDAHGINHDPAELWCSFEVDWNIPMERDQLAAH